MVFLESGARREEVEGRRKRKKVYYAEVTVFEVTSGTVVYSDSFALKGRRMTAQIGETLTAAVANQLKPAEVPPAAVPIEEEPPPAPPEPPPRVEGTGEQPPEMPPPPRVGLSSGRNATGGAAKASS